jgi:hypothetical protein
MSYIMFFNMLILRVFAAVLLSCAAVPSLALALDEIFSPNVDYREISLEYNASRTNDNNPEKNNIQGHELALEVGITPRWLVETSAIFEKTTDESIRISDLELNNRFQFFDQGEKWLDSGIMVAYDHAVHKGDPDSVETKALLLKDFGKITSIANIGFAQDVGVNAAGGPDFALAWNTRYRYSEYFQPGIEIQDDLGQGSAIRRFSEQQAYIGPAVWGRVFGHLKYQAAFYVGASDAAAKTAERILLEYEWHF